MKIVVTGAAGFIGSNIIKGLNARGIDDIIAVDDLTQGDKFRNLADLQIADYVDADDFYELFAEGAYGEVEAVFHEGACSDTMEPDGKYMMDNNYTLSCELFQACQAQGTRLLYASSAATYGGSDTFREVARVRAAAQCLRLLQAAVRPAHAPRTAARHFEQGASQPGRRLSLLQRLRSARAAQGPHGQRGLSPVQPVPRRRQGQAVRRVRRLWPRRADARLRLHRRRGRRQPVVLRPSRGQSGIFNLGTGRAQPFNDVAIAVVNTLRQQQGENPLSLEEAAHGGLIDYIAFPAALVGKYQSYTQADLTALRAAGSPACFCRCADRCGGLYARPHRRRSPTRLSRRRRPPVSGGVPLRSPPPSARQRPAARETGNTGR